MDSETQSHFDELRRRHFPPERNYLAAHVTLFHALPGSVFETIASVIGDAASRCKPMEAKTDGLRSLGHGVSFVIQCPGLQAIRTELVTKFQDLLTVQDRQKWRPHVTVQNKVAKEEAGILMQQLQAEYQPRCFQFHGLDLWHYDGGPWEHARPFSFRS